MTQKVKAIVIKSTDKKEKDKSVLLFSLEKGKFWATLKGVRADKAKLKYAKEPFCFADFVLEEGKGGLIVTNVETIETFHDICLDSDKYFEATALLEIIDSMNFENDAEIYAVFMLLLQSLKTLCFAQVSLYAVILKFLVELFKINGIEIYSTKCTSCGAELHDKVYLNYSAGDLICAGCKTFNCEEIAKGELAILKILQYVDFKALSTVKFNETCALGLLRKLVKNFYFRFDKNLKMIGILS